MTHRSVCGCRTLPRTNTHTRFPSPAVLPVALFFDKMDFSNRGGGAFLGSREVMEYIRGDEFLFLSVEGCVRRKWIDIKYISDG